MQIHEGKREKEKRFSDQEYSNGYKGKFEPNFFILFFCFLTRRQFYLTRPDDAAINVWSSRKIWLKYHHLSFAAKTSMSILFLLNV